MLLSFQVLAKVEEIRKTLQFDKGKVAGRIECN